MSSSDLELLAKYSRQGAEDAFAEVVRRHAGLVYTTALRMTRSSQLAEDVAQSVFLDLARNAGKLRPDTVLIAWLYSVTRRAAASTMRGETRRLVREQTAYAMNATEESSPPPAELEPLLDDAMEALAESDRAAIMLRFFEDKSLTDVGKALGVSADAAQKRVSRAVEQMRGFFTQRGIATGTVAITALLAANSAKAVPVGLVASICAAVHSTIPLTAATLIKTAAMTTLQKSLVGLTVVAAVGVAVRQTSEVTQLREQVKVLQSSAQETRFTQEGNADSARSRTNTRTITTKANGKLTTAQLETKLLSLAEIGVGKFGRANLNQLIAAASVEDIARLLPLVDEKLPAELRQRFHAAWIERWAAADAPAAFAYAVGINNASFFKVGPSGVFSPDISAPDFRAPALDSVLGNWMEQDPAGAAKALEAYTGPNREEACTALAQTWLETDPKAAITWAMAALPDDVNGRSVHTRSLARKWAETDAAEAWRWALALPDSETKALFLTDLAPEAAVAAPAEVAKEVSKMEPGEDQNIAARDVAESWSKTDPRAASEWAAQFPDPNFRREAMEGIARNWAAKDPAAARAWIQTLPAGEEQQQAWWGMTRTLAYKNPEQATETMQNLTDPAKRDWAISDIGENWFRKDPAAARKWLQGQGLPEEHIQLIQKIAAGR